MVFLVRQTDGDHINQSALCSTGVQGVLTGPLTGFAFCAEVPSLHEWLVLRRLLEL